MKDAQPSQPQAIYLADYQTPEFLINETKLTFELFEGHTLVTSELQMVRNPDKAAKQPLVLDGQELELMEVSIDGQSLSESEYSVDSEHLTISEVPDAFCLSIQTKIKPHENTALEGLYQSSGMYCTQCEAEGFRRITYYLDRPDVLSVFETTVIADKTNFPVLLSNGNLTAEKDLENGRHLTTWLDPHKKPCYLFALVAGDLQFIEDHFKTMNGTDVTLRIFVESQNIDKCDYAMDSLKRSMKWDEEVYGREYDLDIFNIVAVDAFNMGAMENKSLNIFNSSCVLANPKTATDTAFQRIEAVVAHEYFHNWSGNRVTCRDWFQLSLKEGFTVFRDAEFSADMGSRTVKRIEDTNMMRTVQFAEDAGPMAHPIRPASFIEISNFYTVTIYEKGAEVVRMIHNLLGKDLFRKGSDLYFDRHDGQAVTTEEFVKAMEDASGVDLTLFRNWYSQAGTPELHVTDEYDSATKTYRLNVKQSCRQTPESAVKKPFHIPLAFGLILEDGSEATLECDDPLFNKTTSVLGLTDFEHSFEFKNIPSKPVPSLLRGFSAPVKLHYDYDQAQLLFLMQYDADGFNCWDAGQNLATMTILKLAQDVVDGKELELDDSLVSVFKNLLLKVHSDEQNLDLAMVAYMLTLPNLAYLIEQQQGASVQALYQARDFVKSSLAVALHPELFACYQTLKDDAAYEPTPEAMAKRSLKNLCLGYLMESGEEQYVSLATAQYQDSDNMTDQSAALSALVNSPFRDDAEACLAKFYEQWQHEPLVVNLWLSIQASSDYLDGVEAANALLSHAAFDIKNPNKVRSVIGAFAGQNLRHFHCTEGYQWLADRIIELDALNPQIASRLVGPLTKWKRLEVSSSRAMREALEKIQSYGNLSKDVFEVVNKSLEPT